MSVFNVVLLSPPCRPVASETHQMASCRAACCRDIALSLGLQSDNKQILLPYKPNDKATSRQTRSLTRFACDKKKREVLF